MILARRSFLATIIAAAAAPAIIRTPGLIMPVKAGLVARESNEWVGYGLTLNCDPVFYRIDGAPGERVALPRRSDGLGDHFVVWNAALCPLTINYSDVTIPAGQSRHFVQTASGTYTVIGA